MEENGENTENYTNMHRSFLQACANLGIMEINKGKQVFQECWLTGMFNLMIFLDLIINHSFSLIFTDNDTHALDNEFRDAINLINKELACIEQKISILISDWDEKEYLVFVNTVEAAMSK